MKLFIPSIGTHLQLQEDWRFILHGERRNKTLIQKILKTWEPYCYGGFGPAPLTLPAFTVLVVDRIYISRRAPSYNSVTFRILKGNCPNVDYEKTRFWAKLTDVNKMICEVIVSPLI